MRANLRYRWLFVMRDLTNPETLERTLALLPRAAAAGCNAVILSSGALHRLGSLGDTIKGHYRTFQAALRQHGMDLIPTVMSVGYGGSLLSHNKNLAEGLPVKEALFIAKGGVAVHAPDPPVAVVDGGFEATEGDRFVRWEGQDDVGKSIFADHQVVHSGGASVRMQDFPPAPEDHPQSRLWQTVKVSPFRQYHISIWIRTENLDTPDGVVVVCVRPTKDERQQLNFCGPGLPPTQDWKQYHVVFNSLGYDEVRIYVGTWGARSGRVWWDDLQMEEVGLLNVLRRPGCPVTVRGEDGRGYEEGRDFAPVHDPNLNPHQIYHEPPAIHLTPSTRIKEGERLRVSYYHPVVIWRDQVVNCLTDPMVYELLEDEVRRVEELLHPSSFFMQHDEIRVANWDAVCQERGLTPGGLLADNMRRCIAMIRAIRPDARLWVWSDMFDPFHNAGPGFPDKSGPHYLVNGSLRDSWEALPPEVGIVNWGSRRISENLKWFSDRGHEQVLAGYYDGDRDGSEIEAWLAAAEGISGVTGAAYTTWTDNFDHLEAWAEKAWGPR
jgi:hypothetical protein